VSIQRRRYDWDERKARANRRKHGIAFADAVAIFRLPTLEDIDDRMDYGEERVRAIGLVGARFVTVIYAKAGPDTIRIISARRATASEAVAYVERVAG
jgi:uncharacterized protein